MTKSSKRVFAYKQQITTNEKTIDTLLLLSNPSEDDEEEHIRNIVESGNKTAVAVKRNDIIISIEEANAARNNELLTSLVGNLEFLSRDLSLCEHRYREYRCGYDGKDLLHICIVLYSYV